MNRLSRPTALKIAAVLSFLLNAIGVVTALPIVTQGATAINTSPDTPPYFIMLMGVILGVVAMVAAYGTWKGQRWGIILTIVMNLIGGLSAAPGILFAPSTGWWISAITGVVASILIIVLCLWPERKLAMA